MSHTKLQIQEEGNKIFAPLKGKWLMNMPEERVRQTYWPLLDELNEVLAA